MSEVETVEVPNIGTPLLAPVEYVGRLIRVQVTGRLHIDVSSIVVSVRSGDTLMVRPELREYCPWRPGRVTVGRHVFDVDWRQVAAACEGDHVYRIGRPTTPTLEERVAELEYEFSRRTKVSP